MSVIFIRTAIGSSIAFATTSVLVYQARKTAREHLKNLDEMMERYKSEDDLALQTRTGNTSRAYLSERQKKDTLWYAQEKERQEAWLAQPFYKQLWGPPFPDYVN